MATSKQFSSWIKPKLNHRINKGLKAKYERALFLSDPLTIRFMNDSDEVQPNQYNPNYDFSLDLK